MDAIGFDERRLQERLEAHFNSILLFQKITKCVVFFRFPEKDEIATFEKGPINILNSVVSEQVLHAGGLKLRATYRYKESAPKKIFRIPECRESI